VDSREGFKIMPGLLETLGIGAAGRLLDLAINRMSPHPDSALKAEMAFKARELERVNSRLQHLQGRVVKPAEVSPHNVPLDNARGMTQPSHNETVTDVSVSQATEMVTDAEKAAYQRRELGKVLLLLQRHFAQGCKIAGKACDCCDKHPMELEALAEESIPMGLDKAQMERVIEWARYVQPMVPTEIVTAGTYAHLYPQLSEQARQLRIAILGTDKPAAILSPEQRELLRHRVAELVTEEVEA